MALTKKQEMFCKEYLVDLNATQAAIRAGYSVNTAAKIGCENLIKPDIESKIQILFDERSKRVELNSDYVLKRLKEIDELDILDIVTDDMLSFKVLSEWPKVWRTSINGLDMQTIIGSGEDSVDMVVKKIKWPDKTKNLELIGRHKTINAWQQEKESSSSEDLLSAVTDLIDKMPN